MPTPWLQPIRMGRFRFTIGGSEPIWSTHMHMPHQVIFESPCFRRFATLRAVAAVALAALLFAGCHRAGTELVPSKLTGPLTLSQWRLLGPFNMSIPDALKGDWEHASERPALTGEWEKVVGHDYLGDLGYREDAVDGKALQSLSRNTAIYRTHRQDGSYLLLHEIFPKLNNAVVYAVTEIVSAEDGNVGIGAGSDDGVRLWLNGHMLFTTSAYTRREARRYDHLCIAHLRRGSNILVAKVDQKEGDWALGVDLMSVQAAREAAIKEREGNMIDRKVVAAGEPLSVRLPILDGEDRGALEIRDLTGDLVWSRQGAFQADFRAILPPLKDGYYACEFQSRGHKTSDSFFLGEPDRVYDRLRRARRQLPDGDRPSLMLDALIERYVQLHQPDRVRRDESNWNRKVAAVLKDGLLALSDPHGLAWQAAEGWHFRRFLSDIDGSYQDYLLYLPDKPVKPMSTVIILPPKVETPRRFLESALLFDWERLDRIGLLAKHYGLALALISGRGNSSDAPIGESDVLEGLRDMERDFPLDRHRLYLFGNCAGSPRALRLAAHFPDLFAGVATYRAEGLSGTDAEQPATRWWSELNSPENLAPSLSNMPVLFIHGDLDPEYPLTEARTGWKRMRERGCLADFQVLIGGKHSGGSDPETLAFPFLIRQYRPDSASQVRLAASRLKYADAGALRFDQSGDASALMEGEARLEEGRLVLHTQNVDALTLRPSRFGIPSLGRIPVDWNGQRSVALLDGSAGETRIGSPLAARVKSGSLEGPIADAFAGPFEIVVGHGGDALAQHSARSVAAALRSTWKSVFFTSCRIREENQVSDNDVRNYHVIFVGEPLRSGRFAGIPSQVPVSYDQGRLSLAGREYNADGLSFAVILRRLRELTPSCFPKLTQAS